MNAPGIEQRFIDNTKDVHGNPGERWLRDLPALLAEHAARWALVLGQPFDLSYNYVIAARRRDGAAVVLKAAVPSPDFAAEIAALKHFNGFGSVRLLEATADQGIVLLERATPGDPLDSGSEDHAATTAADVMHALWQTPPSGYSFPTVASWCKGLTQIEQHFTGRTCPIPLHFVQRAESISKALLDSSDERVLLHGDLHHGNILKAERRPWLAIDPKGVIGEPAFEVGAFLLNPSPQPTKILSRRLDIFADKLLLDRERLREWALIRAVLAAWWMIEDHATGWQGPVTVAERLATA